MPARNEQTAASIFGLAEPQLLAVAVAVAALRVLGKAPVAGTGVEIDRTAAPADGLAGQGLSAPA